ncbi:MAG: hypothetical protein IPO37_01110 [Saprospiraceae bacterium]|nr:hypothetical protein [Saprospiraceae bacterium]
MIRTPLPAREHKRYITGNVGHLLDYIQDQSDSIYREQYMINPTTDSLMTFKKPSVLSNMIFFETKRIFKQN